MCSPLPKIAIKVIDLDGKLTFMSEGGLRVMEVSDFNSVKGCPWPDFWKDAGHAEAKAPVAAAREGRSSRFQGSADTLLGNSRYWDVQVSPILGQGGAVEAILSVSRDITSLKEAEERARLLAAELSHRVKNILALVQSVANQSLSSGKSIEEGKAQLSSRLVALGVAQGLLTRNDWTAASLKEIVEAATEPHGADRFSRGGPPVELSSQAAVAMALTLHELVTNAVKYGALSVPDGHVDIAWTLADGTFTFTWTEHGGPTVSVPERTGFGSRMIGKVMAGYLGGTGTLDYRPEGLVVTLTAPAGGLG